MNKIIDGRLIAKMIKEKVKLQTMSLQEKPTLACILVGDNPASAVYVRQKEKACAECGFESKIVRLDQNISAKQLKDVITNLNNDRTITGILLQLPLPEHLLRHQNEIINSISPNKDVDALTNTNLGKLVANTSIIAPCTASGIIRILESENINLDGKNVVVVGRSLLVGKSVAILLEESNATVTICHSHTRDLKTITKNADILIVAIGKPNFVTKDFVKPDSIVIDVGINRTENGLVGDVAFDVREIASITPVPGGVGPLTVACLMENTLTLKNLSNHHSGQEL